MVPRNILMLITDSGIGGAERVFYEHAISFAERYAVTECYFSMDQGDSPNCGINKVISLSVPKAKTWLAKCLNFFRRINKLNKIKKEGNFDLCISHMEGANWANVLSRKNTVKTITCIHGSLLKDRNRGRHLKKFFYNKVIVPFIYKRADAVVCVSDGIKFELEQLVGRQSNIYSIPNFFDIDKIKKLSEETVPSWLLTVVTNHEVLISIGRLAPEKNFLSLIKIFKAVKEIYPQVKLFLIGAGPEESAIIKEIDRCGLQVYNKPIAEAATASFDIYMLGLQTNPFAILKHCKALLLTSYNEGLPLVLVEAMLCGVPVISYDCTSGPRQIVAPDDKNTSKRDDVQYAANGILIPEQANDVISNVEIKRWQQAVGRVLSERTLTSAMINNAKKRAGDFSKAKITGTWYRLIEQVTMQKRLLHPANADS